MEQFRNLLFEERRKKMRKWPQWVIYLELITCDNLLGLIPFLQGVALADSFSQLTMRIIFFWKTGV